MGVNSSIGVSAGDPHKERIHVRKKRDGQNKDHDIVYVKIEPFLVIQVALLLH